MSPAALPATTKMTLSKPDDYIIVREDSLIFKVDPHYK